MIQIDDDDVQRIARRLNGPSGDPLGIRRYHDGTIDDEHVQEHAMEMMVGIVPMLATMPAIEMDPIASAILSHRGLRPEAVAALASAAGGLGLRDEEGDRIALIENPADWRGAPTSFYVILDDGITRYDQNGLHAPPLPETVLAAAVGMRLSDIVSHPALDPLDIVIASVDDGALKIVLREHEAASHDHKVASS